MNPSHIFFKNRQGLLAHFYIIAITLTVIASDALKLANAFNVAVQWSSLHAVFNSIAQFT